MVEPLLQTSSGLLPDIQEFGCMFRSVQAMAELNLDMMLTPSQINDSWMHAIGQGWLKPTDRFYYLMDPVSLNEYTFELLKHKGLRFTNVKVEEANGTYWIPAWYSKHDYILQSNFTGRGPGAVHYRLMDSSGNLVYDPYPGLTLGSWAQKSYYLLVGKEAVQ